ncbi:hypothetical protein [Hoylesella enoeca]|uniref:Fimbrillin family protein n=1 Tax=Hoylesella enoeca TaxID=76123 RepID=A0A0S2KL57_9BACT|nr:hypothetical protein [Hoylesella enoeca]ALO48804.1 hypothetical protein AS203_06700 [Hoylesella enoeca]
MKTMKLFAAFALTGLWLTACTNEDLNKDNNTTNEAVTTFVSGDELATRTSMDHNIGGKGKFFWTTGDNIWINTGATSIGSTSSSINNKTAHARFYFSTALSGASYPVTYTGKASTKGDEVTIATTQTQSAPNNTEHLGVSGDCGTATAHRDGAGVYNFKLEHKAAYLCFQPRSTNPHVNRSKLIKIEVTSDKPLAGTYGFSASGLSATPTSGASKTIVLNTNQFALDNTTADLDKNGSYMVLAPGLHHLTVCYWLRNTTDHPAILGLGIKPIEGFIPQQITINVEAGKIYDITADLKIPEYEETSLNTQPTASNTANNPNVNECTWLASAGDPHWSDKMLWVGNRWQQLFHGGMWFKKLSVIAAEQGKSESYLKTVASDGNDYVTTALPPYPSQWTRPVTEGIPQKLSDCFFLAAVGIDAGGSKYRLQELGQYWSSSIVPSSSERYFLRFEKTLVGLDSEDLFYQYGFSVEWTPR